MIDMAVYRTALALCSEFNVSRQAATVQDQASLSAIIAMAWADEVPFTAITDQYGLSEPQLIALMRQQLKRSSFVRWRQRVRGRLSKRA